jgi:subtilisin-like proprotein convertase family protein
MTDPQGPGSSWSPSGNPPSDPDVTRLPGAAPAPGQYGAPQYPGYPQGQYPGTGEGQYPGQYPQGYGDPQQQYGTGQQYGEQQYGAPAQYGDPQYGQYAAQPAYPATQQYPDPQYGTPSYGGPPAYGTESYGGAPSYGAPQYGSPYGSGAHAGPEYSSGGYVQSGHYPQGAYGSPPPRSGNRTWILVVALVAVLAIAGGVVTVILLNRDSGSTETDGPGAGGTAPPTIAQGSSSPGAEIPDDSPVGLTDTITLDGGSGTVGGLDVSVNIQHRYPREITAVLTAPSGAQATIFSGDSDTAFRLRSTDPASPLQGLLGGPITGAWRLTLTDDTRADTGVLQSWDITATPGTGAAPAPVPGAAPAPAGGPLTGSSSPGTTVPNDDDTGITDTITLEGGGAVESVRVTVDLPHQAPADLVLRLRAPSGQTVTLADHERNTPFTYSSSDSGSELTGLAGTPAAGPWTLVAIDDIVLDEGVLESWQITVNG